MKRSQRPSALTFTSITTITGIALLGFASSVFAHDHGDHGGIQTRLKGYAEVPSVSSTAKGRFKASINGDTINYELSYRDLEGEVRQAHIHFGQRGVNGGVAVYLCQTSFNPDPTGLAPTCPQSGTVSGTLRAANVVGPAGQGIDATEFAELVSGHTRRRGLRERPHDQVSGRRGARATAGRRRRLTTLGRLGATQSRMSLAPSYLERVARMERRGLDRRRQACVRPGGRTGRRARRRGGRQPSAA